MMHRMLHFFKKTLVKNVLWMMMFQVLRLLVQGIYFVALARTLGASNYGAFIGIIAIAAILTPFADWGSGNILMKNVSRDYSRFREHWGNALLIICCVGLSMAFILYWIAPFIFADSISPTLVLVVALSDLIFLRVIATAEKAFQSMQRIKMAAIINFILSFKNLVGVFFLLALFKDQSLSEWTIIYLLITGASALAIFVIVNKMLGTPKLNISQMKPETADGFYFSISLSAQTINNNVDKTMLASLATSSATGIYAAAYRLIDIAFVPVQSLAMTTYAEFFQQGEHGIRGSFAVAKRVSPIAGLYGLGAGAGLFFIAPVVPHLLGEEYASSADALRWLVPIPFFRALQFFGADTLTGAGFQGVRSVMQVTAALVNILLNLWLIPLFSWRGAAWASVMSDGLLMLSLWSAVYYLYRKEDREWERHQNTDVPDDAWMTRGRYQGP